jgi:hypothetical protein
VQNRTLEAGETQLVRLLSHPQKAGMPPAAQSNPADPTLAIIHHYISTNYMCRTRRIVADMPSPVSVVAQTFAMVLNLDILPSSHRTAEAVNEFRPRSDMWTA